MLDPKAIGGYPLLKFLADLNSSSGQVANRFNINVSTNSGERKRYQKIIIDKSVTDTALLRISLFPTVVDPAVAEGLILITCAVP